MKDENYTLIDLTPEETLVEFSKDSTADPTNWTLVSLNILRLSQSR